MPGPGIQLPLNRAGKYTQGQGQEHQTQRKERERTFGPQITMTYKPRHIDSQPVVL